YRVRAYFKGFISFLLCSVLLNPNNYFCDKQQKHKCCYIWFSCCCYETDSQSSASKGAFCSNAAPCFFISMGKYYLRNPYYSQRGEGTRGDCKCGGRGGCEW